ncbi:VWA domain-containing protein [bacterium 210820-DFI.6.37]|nr:VWA domain-containing protein [bacterium 210820-DFI.6.37]
MKGKRKWISLLVLALVVLMVGIQPNVNALSADETNSGTASGKTWEVSKSKNATNLDENFESKVTLSLPSQQEQLVSDVVLVLDKSTSAALEEQALGMLKDLQTQIEKTEAKVKVGVVIFNKEAHATGFMDLATEYAAIETAVKQDLLSGTNTHAGLLAGKAMLDEDSDVDASRKYLIFVSDGITYMYNAEPTVTAWTFQADRVLNWAGPDNWNSKYGTNNAPDEGWATWLQNIGTQVASQGTQYEYPYKGSIVKATPLEGQDTYANSIDKALYLTYQEYTAAAAAGYHCYAMTANANSGTQYLWGPSFMEYLAKGETVSFKNIKNDINYLLDAGSSVEDYMGYVKDDYNFDFINDASKLSIKVGDKTLDAVELGENRYGFGKNENGYDYEVTYVPGNLEEDEHFIWTINVPVSNFAPVQLTYSVKLTNPKTAAGTYGQYDADGSNGYDGLYTNNSAVLYPVDSSGAKGAAEAFNKPTVSYTVENQPVDPTDPTVPGTIDPGTDPGNTDPGATDPGAADPGATDGNGGTEGTETQTGDDSNMLPYMGITALTAAIAAAVALTGRRKKHN